jgi:large conductance mechanosensitive channel
MLKEFREFAMRGNVVDLAVGLILGVAFGAIVTSFINDIIMPPVGMILGGVDFANLFVLLKEGAKAPAPYESVAAAKAAGAVTLNIGVFINTLINFVFVALAMFLLVKGMNAARRTPPAAASEAPPQEKLLAEIRDLLKARA